VLVKQVQANGKTVLVSSHILPEVQQMADIVGIVSAGRLVTQASLDTLLAGQALVRVRVQPDEAAVAAGVLSRLAGVGLVEIPSPEVAWITARIAADRASEVNRAPASAGVWS